MTDIEKEKRTISLGARRGGAMEIAAKGWRETEEGDERAVEEKKGDGGVAPADYGKGAEPHLEEVRQGPPNLWVDH